MAVLYYHSTRCCLLCNLSTCTVDLLLRYKFTGDDQSTKAVSMADVAEKQLLLSSTKEAYQFFASSVHLILPTGLEIT